MIHQLTRKQSENILASMPAVLAQICNLFAKDESLNVVEVTIDVQGMLTPVCHIYRSFFDPQLGPPSPRTSRAASGFPYDYVPPTKRPGLYDALTEIAENLGGKSDDPGVAWKFPSAQKAAEFSIKARRAGWEVWLIDDRVGLPRDREPRAVNGA